MALRRKPLLIFLIAFVVIALVLYLTAAHWLPGMAYALIWDDGPAPADAAIVLAGDFRGTRLMGGAKLLADALVPVVLVSGPPGMYDINEADAALQFLAKHGIKVDQFVPVRHGGMSTWAEAEVLLAELKKRGVRKVDIVTSNYHTRRARNIFLKLEKQNGGGPEIRMVSVKDPSFDPESWWESRESKKIAFFEWTKLVTSAFGI